MDATDDTGPFMAARGRLDAFVRSRFGWRGTLALHRDALGWDLLRAPANLLLAPLHLLQRGCVRCLRGPAPRVARWLDLHPVMLRGAVARRIERDLAVDLFAFTADAADPRPLPQVVQDCLRTAFPDLPASELACRAERIVSALGAYSGTRSAVAEITTALIAVILGAALFHSLTPGMVSMAPAVAQMVALDRAVQGFPLGPGLGSLWYGLFPVGPPPLLVLATVLALIVAASAITAFAGVLADPVQAALGIHRRRLLRLIESVDSAAQGRPRPFAAREHLYARMTDLGDVGAGLFRLLR